MTRTQGRETKAAVEAGSADLGLSTLGLRQTSLAPPIVREVLGSPGVPLDHATRRLMEPRLGYDFSRVRVHTGTTAARSATSVDARAFVVGRHVVFGEGQYAPESAAGKALLAHELAHVAQQRREIEAGVEIPMQRGGTGRAEQEANEASRLATGTDAGARRPSLTPRPPQLARQKQATPTPSPSGTPAATSPMTRTEFETALKDRFGIQTVRTGTLEEQERRSTRRGASIPPKIDPAAWKSWDPGSSAEAYGWIVAALDRMATKFGGIPQVREIIFFDVHYEQNTSTGAVEAHPMVGASYGAGEMTIYRTGLSRGSAFPVERSSDQPSSKTPVISVQTPGSTPGAPLPLPTPAESAQRNITHELGHGLVETALTPPTVGDALDATMLKDYKSAVGWIDVGGTERLYDIGAKAVQDAMAKGDPPPASLEITDAHWNDPKWKEQPMSGYMVSGGPSEDFPEAVSAFVHTPDILKARSPKRYEFIRVRVPGLKPGLRQPVAMPAPSATGQPARGRSQLTPSLGPPEPARPKFGPLYQPRRDFTREILKSAEEL